MGDFLKLRTVSSLRSETLTAVLLLMVIERGLGSGSGVK